MNFGNHQLPEALTPGSVLGGFKIEDLEQREHGMLWKFSRMNQLYILEMPYDEFFDLLVSPYAREGIVDGMMRSLSDKYADSMGITVVRD